MNLYITFGQAHAHRIGGQLFNRDCVARITARTFDGCRARAFELFGVKFAFSYVEQPDMGYYSRGVIDVPKRKVGRPLTIKEGQSKHVLLDPDTIAKATRLGNGNFTEGVRRAIAQAKE